ncbi:hypothetical protein CHARACLAT_023717 [Characodon lateralis]|uniref:Uncharacterized protein n=1 Tax=Characodon lateralis TaxID=208331 RepID=A0ABU7E6A6_9TELE|nr:hypothetical protein [Characodon lateralis]
MKAKVCTNLVGWRSQAELTSDGQLMGGPYNFLIPTHLSVSETTKLLTCNYHRNKQVLNSPETQGSNQSGIWKHYSKHGLLCHATNKQTFIPTKQRQNITDRQMAKFEASRIQINF